MGAAARARRAQLVNDVSADPRYVTPPGVHSARAELAVPMLYGEEVLGVSTSRVKVRSTSSTA